MESDDERADLIRYLCEKFGCEHGCCKGTDEGHITPSVAAEIDRIRSDSWGARPRYLS